ncbi:MAG: RluA family pseudouridine synthase [Bdellovibrionaceae bacterium]|nr:RluA family pseudouridine synthase [Pseudobdellovibrionaceae bacterium]
MRSNKIRHLIVASPVSEDLSEAFTSTIAVELRRRLDLDESSIHELFRLGAVYLNKSRRHADAPVRPGDYLRVHTEPRRYQRPAGLERRILWRDERWLLLDKPPGVPCHPTLDNGVENLLTWLAEILGRNVHITHRLDGPTSGCLMFAFSARDAGRFNKLMLKDQVSKEYEALVEGEFTRTGPVTHWMKKGLWAPREVRDADFEDSLECRLDVLSAAPLKGGLSRLRLRLHTGRTHQIRAQMAALGHPVWNDQLYGARPRREEEVIGLRACVLVFRDPDQGGLVRSEAPARWRELFPDLDLTD